MPYGHSISLLDFSIFACRDMTLGRVFCQRLIGESGCFKYHHKIRAACVIYFSDMTVRWLSFQINVGFPTLISIYKLTFRMSARGRYLFLLMHGLLNITMDMPFLKLFVVCSHLRFQDGKRVPVGFKLKL